MACPTKVILGDDLVFGICTHDPDTGVLTDTDMDPIYRIYEDENASAILTGTMSSLQESKTTGFYTERISGTVLEGFENGKTYTIYIEATVDGETGGMCYAFRAIGRGCLEADSVRLRRSLVLQNQQKYPFF